MHFTPILLLFFLDFIFLSHLSTEHCSNLHLQDLESRDLPPGPARCPPFMHFNVMSCLDSHTNKPCVSANKYATGQNKTVTRIMLCAPCAIKKELIMILIISLIQNIAPPFTPAVT